MVLKISSGIPFSENTPNEYVIFSNKPPKPEEAGVKVHGLKIDKIVLTLNVPEEDHTGIMSIMMGVTKADGFKQLSKKPQYRINYQFTEEHSGKQILFQGAPFSKKSAFARFEFNPSKLGPQGVHNFFTYGLAMFMGPYYGYSEIWQRAKVNRIDIAVDVEGAGMENLIFKVDSDNKYMAYFGNGGGLETMYGKLKKKGNHDVIMYDKAKQLEAAYNEFVSKLEELRKERLELTKKIIGRIEQDNIKRILDSLK